MVARDAGGSATPARAPLAAKWRGSDWSARPAGQSGRGRRAPHRRTVHRLSQRARDDVYALSTLPPGRFLMPGDLAGSPGADLRAASARRGATIAPGSLAAMMARRYEAYKAHVARPFFRDHFARLDRQIVLVDALFRAQLRPRCASRSRERADRGPARLPHRARLAFSSSIFRPRIDRILFAATKADHLHHKSHDRLEAILRALTAKAIARAKGSGRRST